MGKTYKVQPQWFKKTDKFGKPFSIWCKKVNNDDVLCIVCDKKISCTKKGFAALTQHAATSVHMDCAAVKLNSNQLLLKSRETDDLPVKNIPVISANNNLNESAVSTVQLFDSKAIALKAELIWAMKTVQCNMVASTTDDLQHVFEAMFLKVPENFSLGRTKLSYLITEALGPYFKKELVSDIGKSFFALQYDETTNSADKKELQFKIRYWSAAEEEIVCKHLQTVFIGHATSEDIVSEIIKVLNVTNLSINKLIMLGSDGPNVNKKVWNHINHLLTEERGHGLLEIGTCNLHIMNNAFLKGLVEFGDIACELVSDIYYFFKKFPARWEDYETVQIKKNVPKTRFLKHISSRWLTAGPACERLLEQWAAVEDYFFVFIPSNSKQIMQTSKFKQIVKSLKYVDIKVELHFVIESAELFTSFSTFFQRSEPLIHVLHSKLSDILQRLTGRICKSNTDPNILITTENLLQASEVDCNSKTAFAIKCLIEKDRLNVFYKIQRHYMAAHNYLINKIEFKKYKLLSYCKCLHPTEITKNKSLKLVGELGKALFMIEVNPVDIKDEWRMLQSEVCIPDYYVRVDHFWREVLKKKTVLGEEKYPLLKKLVKVSLCLSHGNSDLERGFSISKRTMADDKSRMSERVLNDRLLIKDSIKKYKHVGEIPITRELLKLAYGAHKSYIDYLEEQRKEKEKSLKEKREKEERMEEEKQKQAEIKTKTVSIEKLETKVKIIAQEKKDTQQTADSLLKEANNRLKLAIEKNDLPGIRMAQGMLEGAEKLRKMERCHEEKEKKLNLIVNKRKSSLIDAFITKKPKNT